MAHVQKNKDVSFCYDYWKNENLILIGKSVPYFQLTDGSYSEPMQPLARVSIQVLV